MPAKAKELMRAARQLGFVQTRQKGSHARWQHTDGRATTIPIHPGTEIGGWLFREILKQLGISEAGQILFCKLIEHQTEGGFWFSMLR